MVFYICIVILSVMIHEFGHLFSALYFNLNVKAFSFGFGPILLHKTWKNIDWRISLIPLGGYCSIEESLEAKNSLANILYWKQVIVLMSGVFLNLLVACVCYIIQYQSISKGIIIDLMFFKYMFTEDYDSIVLIFTTFKSNMFLTQISFCNLGFFITNILPIPALDGGYLWMFPLRRKMGEKIFKIIIYTFFGLLSIIQLLLVYYFWGEAILANIEAVLGWLGTGLFFYGVWALAKKNICGFWANGVANILYATQGILMKNWPLVACSVGLFLINIYGINEWRTKK